jgi:hypothetical protein
MKATLSRVALATVGGFALLLAAAGCADRGRAPGRTSVGVSASAVFRCPITIPNGQAPPGERRSPFDFGNRRLWTLLPVNGKLVVSATLPLRPGTVFGELHRDGSMTTKFPWWGARSAGPQLRITGTRLDLQAMPLRARITRGFTGAQRFWATAIRFTSGGCWRVTGTAGTHKLTFALEVMKAD